MIIGVDLFTIAHSFINSNVNKDLDQTEQKEVNKEWHTKAMMMRLKITEQV